MSGIINAESKKKCQKLLMKNKATVWKFPNRIINNFNSSCLIGYLNTFAITVIMMDFLLQLFKVINQINWYNRKSEGSNPST